MPANAIWTALDAAQPRPNRQSTKTTPGAIRPDRDENRNPVRFYPLTIDQLMLWDV